MVILHWVTMVIRSVHIPNKVLLEFAYMYCHFVVLQNSKIRFNSSAIICNGGIDGVHEMIDQP